MALSRDDAKRLLVQLLPEGYDDLVDLGPSSNAGKLLYALGGGWRDYGDATVETIRREASPLTVTENLDIWEDSLGLSETPIAQYGTTAQRRNAVLAWLRQAGSFSLDDIRAIVQPYFLYADPSDIEIIETSRSALTTLHTYSESPIVTVTAGNSYVKVWNVLDDADVAAGTKVRVNWTGTISTTTAIVLIGPAIKSWDYRHFGTGAALADEVSLWAPEFAGMTLPRTWRLVLFSGANNVTINSWSLFAEGIGAIYDGAMPPNRIGQGLGAGQYEFAVVADEALLGTGYDLAGALRALFRAKPAHVNCTITWRASGAADACAIPDTRSATPDAAIPCS